MLGKSVCILFSGHAGVGKTTSSAYLHERLNDRFNCAFVSFASNVKKLARLGYGWDGQKDQKGRRLLQGVGQVARAYNPDFWVSALFEEDLPSPMNDFPYDIVSIDDWRFQNEYAFIARNPLYSVYTVRIVAPEREILKGTPEYNEISEIDLDNFKFDYVIDNSGSFTKLHNQLDDMLVSILAQQIVFG